ncbi:MAG: putative Actin, partial [Streblomastix strix]
YEMPDGQILTIGSERFKIPEALLQPQLFRSDSIGVHDLLYQAITNCDPMIQKDLYSNIVLSGGSSLFEGFSDRLHKEIADLAPNILKVIISASPDRKNAAWVGGSILASLSTFRDMCITKEEYNESGAGIVNRKCV